MSKTLRELAQVREDRVLDHPLFRAGTGSTHSSTGRPAASSTGIGNGGDSLSKKSLCLTA